MVDEVKDVLMSRDGLDEFGAEERVEEVKGILQEAVNEENASLCELENIVKEELGLEPDYLDELLFGM